MHCRDTAGVERISETSDRRSRRREWHEADVAKYLILRVYGPAHWRRGCWEPIAIWAALQALLAGATLAVKSDGKDRANGQAER
jgi:hypothetical protein